MGVTMPSVEFKLFVNETKLLVLTYVQTHLDDNSRLTSMTALNAYLATDKRSLPTELESIATFQQRLLVSLLIWCLESAAVIRVCFTN